MEPIIETKELIEVRTQTTSLITQARDLALAIKDKESYDRAADLLLYAKGLNKKIVGYFKDLKDPINRAKDEILKKEKEALAPVEQVEKQILGPAMSAFTVEMERQRRIAQDKALAEARRLEEESRLNAAVSAEQDGDKAVAEEILNTPAPLPPVDVPKFEEARGLHDRTTWKGEITNLRELIKGILDGKVPITAIDGNLTVINQAARAMKQEMNWPGVRAYPETTKVGRTF